MTAGPRDDPRLAVLADIHGNRWALEGVLADLTRRGIQRYVNLGDCAYGPLDPAGTLGLLMARGEPTVRGNEDRALIEPGGAGADAATLAYVRRALAPQQLAWLAQLPLTLRLAGDLLLCHGTPDRDDEYLLYAVRPQGGVRLGVAELERRLAACDARTVLCGHDHTPARITMSGGRLIANPGSVGLPAYRDDAPHPHIMESGTPHARYGIATRSGDGWTFEQVALDYDWPAAAAAALHNGRPDWAHWLATGCA